MSYINESSILKKIESALKSKGISAQIKKAGDELAKEAADIFIGILVSEILSCGFNTIGSLSHSDVVQDLGNGQYTINIWFNDELNRASLNPNDELDNIVALLNKGYSRTRVTLRGVWHGNIIHSKRERAGAHFIESAITRFTSQYGAKYGVVSIDVDDEYL